MGKMEVFKQKWDEFQGSLKTAVSTTDSVYTKIKNVIGILVMCVYRLRKVFLAIPVLHYALKLAEYNKNHLPEQVGLNLQSTGEFAMTITRDAAVSGPLMVTVACLVLMFTSRKALYPWAVSLFTLILPLLLLISNLYPA